MARRSTATGASGGWPDRYAAVTPRPGFVGRPIRCRPDNPPVLRPRSLRAGRALPGDPEAGSSPDAQATTESWPRAWAVLPRLARPTPTGLGAGAVASLGALRGSLDAFVARVVAAGIPIPIAIAIVSRLYAGFALALTPILDPDAGIPRLLVFRSPFLQWDAQWYVQIANLGYHAGPMQSGPFGGRHDFAFFPAWPMLLSGVQGLLGVAPGDAAMPLANLLFVLAAVVMFVVLDRQFGRSAATWGIVLIAFSPPSFVLSMAYSEPLYLLLIAGVFATTGPLRIVLAGVIGITRVSGAALALASGIRWLRRWRDWTALLTAASIGVAFAAWWGYIWMLTGDPLGWFEGSAQWMRTLGLPAIWSAIVSLSTPRIGALLFVALILGASVALLRVNLEMGIYCVVAIGLSLVGAPVESMPRHALAAFPAFGLLAARLGPRRSRWLAIAFAALEINYVLISFTGRLPLAP